MSIEKMKLEAEMLRVQSARAEMRVNVEERKLEIERLESNIQIQDKKINELQIKLQEQNK